MESHDSLLNLSIKSGIVYLLIFLTVLDLWIGTQQTERYLPSLQTHRRQKAIYHLYNYNTQQTEGYLPSIQLQHTADRRLPTIYTTHSRQNATYNQYNITTNITPVTLTATNTSNHRCLWLTQWVQKGCYMFHLGILDFLNVTLYMGEICAFRVSGTTHRTAVSHREHPEHSVTLL